MTKHRLPGHALVEPDILLARAWTAACAGAPSAGISYALQAADWARGHGQPASELAALHTALRLGDVSTAPRIEAVAPDLVGPRSPAVLSHARALVTGDGEALIRAAHQLQDLGDRLAAADATAQAAVAFARHGLHGSRASAAERATRLQQACDGARTPALPPGIHPLPLTDREREVVTLAAQGLSNRDIADRLVLSVRTVEGHLYRATGKLGFERRADLKTLFE